VAPKGCTATIHKFDSLNNQVHSIKGDIHSIGGYKTRTSDIFSEHDISLQKGDIMYLTTDGYTDQSDVSRKRFGSAKFLKLLGNIAAKPLTEQQTILDEELKNYMQTSDQRDDITIVGLKIC